MPNDQNSKWTFAAFILQVCQLHTEKLSATHIRLKVLAKRTALLTGASSTLHFDNEQVNPTVAVRALWLTKLKTGVPEASFTKAEKVYQIHDFCTPYTCGKTLLDSRFG